MTVKELKEFLNRKFVHDDEVVQVAIHPNVDTTFDIDSFILMGNPDNRIILIGKPT